ncbi:hypothetical protein HOY80DRAFT_1025755 [Tuber brumale]|nr:hypothetical protein HOY80DRAFT_1025755 [Tuber brumale]
MPKATMVFHPESRQTETDCIWKITGLANNNEYAELIANRWNNYRNRSRVPSPYNSRDAYCTDQQKQSSIRSPSRLQRLDAAGAREIQLDRIREISLLIFTSLAMMFICGTIVKTMVKIDRKIHRLMEPDVLGFEYKKARRSALHRTSYCRAIIVIIAKFLLLIAVIIYLKGLLDHGIGGA